MVLVERMFMAIPLAAIAWIGKRNREVRHCRFAAIGGTGGSPTVTDMSISSHI